MSERKEYPLSITINNRQLSRVVIDQHYQIGHPEMSDDLIIELVKTIDNGIFPIENEKDGFEYFKVEPVEFEEKPYRLVLLMYVHDNFLGVINAFRVGRK